MRRKGKKIIGLLRSFGLYKEAEKEVPESRYKEYIKVTDSEKSLAHMEFLKSLNEDENSRLELIESKTSQLIAQTGLIFSLLSLFIPLLVDKVSDLNLAWKAVLLIMLLLAFGFYMLTIRNALKNFRVSDFKYSRPMPQNVINLQEDDLNVFYSEVVRDYIFSLDRNNDLNNTKATNLLQSYMAFKIANLLAGILVVLFCISVLFIQPGQPTISITGPVKVEGLDSIMSRPIRFELKNQSQKMVITNRINADTIQVISVGNGDCESNPIDSIQTKAKVVSDPGEKRNIAERN